MRFHCGISFSLKFLRKYIIPILIGLLAYFGFNGIFDYFNLGILKVNALVDSNSTFNVTIPDYDSNFENYSCGTENVKDFLHNFLDTTDFSSTYYDLFIDNNFESQIVFYLIPKNNDNINNFLVYRGSENSFSLNYTYRYWIDSYSNARWYYLFYKSCTSDISSSSSWQSFLTALNTGSIGSTTADNVGQLSSNSSNSIPYFGGIETITSRIYQGTSYDVSLWYYFSSRQLQYNATTSSLNQNGLLFKKLYLVDNDTTYNIGDDIPSYYDLHGVSPTPSDPTFIGYQDSLKTSYTNLNVSDVSNYNLKLKFKAPQSVLGVYQDVSDYLDSTSFDYICSGRINNSNYYTYESFNCNLSNSYTISDNIIEYTFNNLSINQSLSNYDKIYVTIKSNFLDQNYSSVVYDLTYTYTLGSYYNTDYKGSIYDNFDNLPLNFKVYFSSNNSNTNSKLYVKDYNFVDYGVNYIGFSNNTQQQNLVVGESILGGIYVENGVVTSNYSNQFVSVDVTNNIDTGIMIYQQNSAIPLPSLKLFFNSGIVISFNNTSSDDFYYVDSTGNITQGSFIKPLINSNDNYDISYYINQVNNFINGLSADSLEFATLTQNFYNNMPTFFQTFIFVVFILFCFYFTYLLIKKW